MSFNYVVRGTLCNRVKQKVGFTLMLFGLIVNFLLIICIKNMRLTYSLMHGAIVPIRVGSLMIVDESRYR